MYSESLARSGSGCCVEAAVLFSVPVHGKTDITMLHEFLTANRQTLITRCRAKVAKRSAPRPSDAELQHGIPLFLEQLVKTLELEQFPPPPESRKVSGPSERGKTPVSSEIGTTAAKHGNELL